MVDGPLLVGIDCATLPSKTGVAVARGPAPWRIEELFFPRSFQELADRIAGLARQSGPILLALDAPLGWPVPFTEALAQHRAGDPLLPNAHQLFRRGTDDFVHRLLGKLPLEVAADRIARAAKATLDLLAMIRASTGIGLSLAWSPDRLEGISAIEVYPAATLACRSWPTSRYKLPDQREARKQIVELLRGSGGIQFSKTLEDALDHADLLDAVLCIVAGSDFLSGECLLPPDRELAAREGWIWVRPPVPGYPRGLLHTKD